ncbi:innexin shaking-B-like [Dermacentor albipictus]|uniref:innexin shaking-B-like n=1 Tax=Dermacentor albipictus TaxID=60249 RepID=UPI0031FD1C5D
MLHILGNLKKLLSIRRVSIDCFVFRLHHQLTVLVLVAFAVLVTTKQYVGDPIECDRSSGVPAGVINVYCWIHATYSVKSLFSNADGKRIVYPGVGNGADFTDRADVKYHKYYQWVCLVLFFQALCFYLPRWLWKAWEGGRLKTLVQSLEYHVVLEPDVKRQRTDLLVRYLLSNLGSQDWYAWKYFACEAMALFNVVCQLFFIDLFLDGEFLTYGVEVLSFVARDEDYEDRVDPMVRVFPRVAKCHFHKFGSSGNVETHDAVCVLPLNIVNEKIYVFLWFWFVILAALTGVIVIQRTVLVFSRALRSRALHYRFHMVPAKDLREVLDRGSLGDWFLLYMMGQNVEARTFAQVIAELADHLREEPNHRTLIAGDKDPEKSKYGLVPMQDV